LLVDNDRAFLSFATDIAHARGFRVLATHQAGEAVALARDFLPHAVLLDIRLEDLSGWRVLDYLKCDWRTRHIPVNVISTDDHREHGLLRGARRVLVKPLLQDALDGLLRTVASEAESSTRRLLVVEDDVLQRGRVLEMLGSNDIDIVCATTGAEAIANIKAQRFDAVLLDLGLPDTHGVELLRQIDDIAGEDQLPVIVHSATEVPMVQLSTPHRVCRAVVPKKFDARLLLDTVDLWLHRKVAPATPQNGGSQPPREDSHALESILAGKHVLIVDDDVRNIFALTSLLERYHMRISRAENGRSAIEQLERAEPFDVVLMDIMMPEMDGYDTIRSIRSLRHNGLPIVAVTAKAMRGDREKCLAVGASDYVTKPIDSSILLSCLGTWLGANPALSRDGQLRTL
jgi:CheY-like chemotaxis protein